MTKIISISKYPLWEKAKKNRSLLMISLELTLRCNNNCIHCYNNLPRNNAYAVNNELSTNQIKNIVDQAVEMGTLWMHLTGGEVFLRKDFCELYEYMVKKGLLVAIFTNATLITDEHIKLFKQYPPRDIEITVYGIPEKTYTAVTRTNNYSKFTNGLEKLLSASIPVTLKAMMMKSNYNSFKEIADFCKQKSYKNFRFDPFLNLRTDKNQKRNHDIINQRLSGEEIIKLEKQDPKRLEELTQMCQIAYEPDGNKNFLKKIFKCGAGLTSCTIDSYGFLKLCIALTKQSCTYDLKKGSLKDAWYNFIPTIRSLKSNKTSYHDGCSNCNLRPFCMWCPARSELETNDLDEKIKYFCNLALARHNFCNDL